MNDKPDVFGTPTHHLYRKDDPQTSVDAAHSIDTTTLESMVYDGICASGDKGCIADELLEMFEGFRYSSITARFSALERKGLITCGPDKRCGVSNRKQRVMRKALR
jgi:hypothetical protein